MAYDLFAIWTWQCREGETVILNIGCQAVHTQNFHALPYCFFTGSSHFDQPVILGIFRALYTFGPLFSIW